MLPFHLPLYLPCFLLQLLTLHYYSLLVAVIDVEDDDEEEVA